MSAFVTGDKAIDRKLAILSMSVQKKVVKPAINKALQICAKAMKAEIPAQYKDAKKSIGWRFGKSKRTGEMMAKAGAGVGAVGRKKALEKHMARQEKRRAGHPGVGISSRNIQWFIIGTGERSTGSKRVRSKGAPAGARQSTGKPVHSTGRMRPLFEIKGGFTKSESAQEAAILDVSREKLAQLVK